MDILTYSDVRKHLTFVMDRAAHDRAETVNTRASREAVAGEGAGQALEVAQLRYHY